MYKKTIYYDKKDQPIEGPNACLEWGRQFEDNSEGHIVKQQTTWLGFWVSTVWLGLDHSFGGGRPLLYETMVFKGGQGDIDMCRYSTRNEAVLGHRRMFINWSNPIFVLNKLFINQKWSKMMRFLKHVLSIIKNLWYRFWHENIYCRW